MQKTYLKVNQEPKTLQRALASLSGSDGPGIYKLYYFENGQPRKIQRLFGEDINGLLYVGMTEGTLINRVRDLQKALLSNSEKDMLGPASSGHTQMGKKYYRIRNKIDVDNLFIEIFPNQNPKQAETNDLEDYVNKFAELPPLNGQYGSYDPDWSKFC
ncbi:hypothetical protein [uncultured Zobellia sp.]|uniref:hypothetical protein n=1 Tax=uncultured Zobellia sp. TaxID=255433 RepID=UPI002597740B|nr:hypothetical protein [uncultured Zobellia sp.]